MEYFNYKELTILQAFCNVNYLLDTLTVYNGEFINLKKNQKKYIMGHNENFLYRIKNILGDIYNLQ